MILIVTLVIYDPTERSVQLFGSVLIKLILISPYFQRHVNQLLEWQKTVKGNSMFLPICY